MGDLTAKQVCTALYRHWSPSWAVLFELTAAPPLPAPEGRTYRGLSDADRERERRIDVLALRPTRPRYSGDGWERLAVEVKVARADFLSDVRDPHKQQLWRDLTHAFAYAAPAGLIKVDELPDGTGLIEVGTFDLYGGAHVGWVRKARWRDHVAGPLPHRVLNTVAHRMARAEALARGYSWSRADDDPESMRVELDRLRHELELAQGRTEAERRLRVQWQERYAAVGDPPCSFCGQPLRISRRRSLSGWEHRIEHETACEVLRRSQAEETERVRVAEMTAAQRARYPGPSAYLYVPPPYPAERLEVAS